MITKTALECGLTIEEMEFEPIGGMLEMQGPSGGWFVATEEEDFVAYNAREICEQMREYAKETPPTPRRG
jgi:hypothetical protein